MPEQHNTNEHQKPLPDPKSISLYDFARAFRFGDNPVFNFRVLQPKLQNLPKPTDADLEPFKKETYPRLLWLRSLLAPYGVESKEFNADRSLELIKDPKDSAVRRLGRVNAGRESQAVYFVVNQGGQKKKDIKQFTAFFGEWDDIAIEEQYAKVMAFAIVPHVIVRTRSSLHCYWLADEATTADEWERVQRTFIVANNSDPQIKDLPRVMRLPGFDHTTFDFETGKVSRVPVTCLKFDTTERITAGQILEMLAQSGQAEVSKAEFDAWQRARNAQNQQRAKVRQERERNGAVFAPLYTDEQPADLQRVFDDICARITIVGPAGEDQRGICPCCEDPNPSLILGLKSDKILMMCHAGCTFGELCAAVGVEQRCCFKRHHRRGDRPVTPVQTSAQAAADKPDLSPEGVVTHANQIFSDGDRRESSQIEEYAGSQNPAELAAKVWKWLDESERARSTMFAFNEVMVRVAESKKDPGVLSVQSITAEMMRYRLNRLVNWWKYNQIGNEVDCPAPTFLVADMMATPLIDTPIPVLNRITAEPIFDRNGSLVSAPGFHRDSGIYYTPRFQPLPVPTRPTKEQMLKARDFLTDLISDFPFEDEYSRDNAIAIGLVPFVREMVRGPVPLGFPTAAVPRTGKTKLLKILLGRGNYAMITYSAEEPEMRKKITTAIMSGFASVIIDNVNGVLDSAPLAAVLTGEVWNDRLLCTNQACNILPTIQWTATANNPVTSREISGRSVVARLVAQTDRPEERDDFKIADIELYAEENRAKIAQAFLTMAAYWIAEGMPAPEGVKLGGFEQYVRVVGGILQRCGLTLLKNYRETSDALDSERSALAALCNAWWTSDKALSTDGVRTIPWKAGKIWEIAKDIEGLPIKVRDALGMGYYLRSLHERRVEFVGLERDADEGEKIENIPQVCRRFIIRKCTHTVQKSHVYQLELSEESRVGVVGVVGVSQTLPKNTVNNEKLSTHEENGTDPHARARAYKTPTTPTTPTSNGKQATHHRSKTKDLGEFADTNAEASDREIIEI